LATPPSEGPRVGQPWPASQGRLYVAWASKFRRFGPEGSRGPMAPPGQEGNFSWSWAVVDRHRSVLTSDRLTTHFDLDLKPTSLGSTPYN